MKLSLKKEYKEIFKLLIKVKWYTVLSLGIFFLAFFIGFAFPIFYESELKIMLSGMANMFVGLSIYKTITTIFFNNLRASFVSLIFGLAFGIMPLFSSIFNGYVGGFVGRLAADIQGLNVLLRFIPHGIFELTAIFISMGLALYLANLFLKEIFKIKKQKNRFLLISLISIITFPINLHLNMIVSGMTISSPEILLSNPAVILLVIFNMLILSAVLIALYLSSKNEIMKEEISKSIKTFCLIIIPLLIIAAIIEGILIGLGI